MKLVDSFIFTRVALFLFFVINLFAIYLLLRGHNYPGGGFIGGLGAAMSLVMLTLAMGAKRMQEILPLDPVRIAAAGLLLAMVSSTAPMLWGAPFLTQYNFKFADVPVLGSVAIGTPLSFDLGVYLAVVGVTIRLILILARPVEDMASLDPEDRVRYASRLEVPVESASPNTLHDAKGDTD